MALQKGPIEPKWFDGRTKWADLMWGRFRRGQHINLSEVDALALAVRNMSRFGESHDHRILAFNDSQVTVGSVSKGRSSRRALMSKIRRLTAVLLAARYDLGLRWVPTAFSPADEPSRRRGRRGRNRKWIRTTTTIGTAACHGPPLALPPL